MQTLKITFNGKNKMISASNSAYKEITGKIYNSFNLNNDKIYHFFYLDDEQQKITISDQIDYETFITIELKHKKLFIEETKDQKLDMLPRPEKEPEKKPSLQEKNQSIKSIIEEKKEQLSKQMKVFKEEIAKNMMTKLEHHIDLLKDSRKSDAVHKNFKCSNEKCKDKHDIKGIRFQCAICEHFNLCENCQVSNSYTHPKNHPFIRIRNEQQRIQFKKNTLKMEGERTRQSKSQFQIKQEKKEFKQEVKREVKPAVDINLLMEITNASKQRARQLINKYPTANLEYLVQVYFFQEDRARK